VTDEFSPQDKEIIQHLKALDNSSAGYPAQSLKNRRDAFREEASALIIGLPAAGFLKSRLGFLSNIPAKTLEYILIGVLVAQAGLGAYIFRDEIREWFTAETSTPVTLQSTWTPRPTLTETPTATETATSTATITLPTATLKTPPTDQGLHLGQTKTPKP
jgi:hypothetical protein